MKSRFCDNCIHADSAQCNFCTFKYASLYEPNERKKCEGCKWLKQLTSGETYCFAAFRFHGDAHIVERRTADSTRCCDYEREVE